ncbi:uncharacterized protein EDB91DRAFT_1257584 [Suillus paluster]|uniref:uncharacterized protein n=1 Tax=Suillus paluster TaxID=48578 RepID=UPI001B872739|nr:uncharacterized protein EDB91DRAFT_1257584 [Suillus paluster]KAG1719516.1 hypothetical protein EDB91DRAFT_1257584 [Suillus paluster]
MPSSLRPRAETGLAITNTHLKINWSTETSTASSPLDAPEHSPSSPLTSLDSAEDRNAIPSPKLEVPDLDLELSQFELETPSRHRKTEPLTSISTMPDYNLSAFFPLAELKHSMPTETPQIFHGDGRKSENPADFLKSFNRAMGQQATTASNDKLEAFGDYLGTGSEAEVWFKGLVTTQTATWMSFVTVFETRWPPIEIAKKMKAEQERELLEHRLTDVDVGTNATLYDRECWSHEAWATKAQQLATSAGIEASTSMIWQVRGGLPNIIKDLLKDDKYKNWAASTKEVKELKGNRLLEKKEQHSKQEHEVTMLCADVAQLQQHSTAQNPITAIQNQFSRMSIAPSKPPNMSTSSYTVTCAPAQQTDQFLQHTISHQPATSLQPLIITEEMKNATQQLVSSFMHHPDMPTGHTAYMTQIAQWNAKWGENTRVLHETEYPLKLGTAAIALSECFNCGTHGHNSQNCVLPTDHVERLSRKEAVWQAITSRVLGAFNQATVTTISLVINGNQEMTSAWIEEVPEEQGKVDGLT